eukprot:1944670-Amphidinium_carterae.1
MAEEVRALAEVSRSLSFEEEFRVELLAQYAQMFCKAEIEALLLEHFYWSTCHVLCKISTAVT